MVILQNPDSFQNVTDPDWTSQQSYPHEFADLEPAWGACPVDPSIQKTRFDVCPTKTVENKQPIEREGWAGLMSLSV